MSERSRVALLHGGYSGENVISHQTAEMMQDALKALPYDVIPVRVDDDGFTAKLNDKEYAVDLTDFSVAAPAGRLTFDVALIAIHGTPGEDGKLQGYLEMIGIPYTTGGVLNMALTFNKAATTAQLKQLGFAVAESKVFFSMKEVTSETLLGTVGLPCFVKPNNGGSSIGMSRVNRPEDLLPAIEKAFREDDQVMVEAFLTGREITCGVIDLNGAVTALPPVEVRSPNEFFDFEAKYNDQRTEEIIPAPIPADMTRLCQLTAERIFKALNCRGMVRIDMMMSEKGFSVIEVNTVPGFTKASILPKMLKEAGIEPKDLLDSVIKKALQEHAVQL